MKTRFAKFQRSCRAFFARNEAAKPKPKPRYTKVATATGTTNPDVKDPPEQSADNQEPGLQPTVPHQKGLEVEALPPEVRRYLLSVLELPELKALVRASPVYHQQYLFDRRYILRSSLLETLGEASVDAYAAHICDPYTKEAADEALNILESKILPLKDLRQPVLEHMARFYLRNVDPLMEPFFRPALDTLEKSLEVHEIDVPNRSLLQSPPRGIEKSRLARAIYRYQIYSLVSSRSWYRGEWSRAARKAQRERIERFIELNHPWEIEQLISFYESMVEPFEEICLDIEWDVTQDSPREEVPFGAANDWFHYFDSETHGTAFKGIPLLRSLMFDVLKRQDRIRLLYHHIVTEYTPFIDMETLRSEYFQKQRRKSRPSQKDKMQASRDPLPFRGDSDLEAPPLGWTILWHGTYSNLCGNYNDGPLRKWAYVFLDAKRLEQTGARELFERVCELDDLEVDAREQLSDDES